MRILHVTDTFAPTIGGIEVHVADLALRQAMQGHHVSVVTPTPAPPDPSDDASPVLVSRDPTRLPALLAEADVVHAHVSAFSPLAIRAATQAAGRGIPTVAVVHSMWSWAWPTARAASVLGRWWDLPIQWAAVSEAAAGPVRRAFPHGDVLVLPNAVDTALWSSRPGPRARSEVTIVSVGRMARRKRPLATVDVLRRVREAVPSHVTLKAVLIGDGPLRARVSSRVGELGLDSWVAVPGAMPRSTLRSLYPAADVFIAPATLESFGIAALEARSAGLAVVARRGTGTSDFIDHGVDGFLAGSDRELASQVIDLCTDPELLARLTRHNRSTPPRYDWSWVLESTSDAYARAGAAARSGARILTP